MTQQPENVRLQNFDDEIISEESSSNKKSNKKFLWGAIIIAVGLAVGLAIGFGKGSKECEPTKQLTKNKDIQKNTLTTTTKVPPTTPEPERSWTSYRLPSYIVPVHYDLKLMPHIAKQNYTGINNITVNITQKTNMILFHAGEKLEILSVLLSNRNGKHFEIERQIRYPKFQFYEVLTKDALDEGIYYIFVEFHGSLANKTIGLYLSKYQDPENNKTNYVVSSDMEPMDARKAFPCFDEPALKARFTTSILHDENMFALSNMNVEDRKEITEGLALTSFKTSVPMSSYLACFVVSNFSYVERLSKRGIPLRIYAAKHHIDKGRAEYGINATKIIFDYFEELFDMNFHLPKLDQVAIPDYPGGAMENWGLITYRESALLWDAEKSSTKMKQRVVTVIAHELTHMWFGNTVTMKWWNNIWLNEGFASYFEYWGVNKVEPTWKMLNEQMVTMDVRRAMAADSSVNSRPLIPEEDAIVNSSTAKALFGAIPYSKGASIIRMMHNMLGEDNFIGGLRRYLKKFRFQNTDEKDLLLTMQEYLDENKFELNITEALNPWLLQMGYPVLNVETKENSVFLTQEHMLLDSLSSNNSKLSESPFNYKWNIFVNYKLGNTVENKTFDMHKTDITIKFENSQQWQRQRWVLLNPDQHGYYRVHYNKMWEKFGEQLNNDHTVFSETDRSSLLSDVFTMAVVKKVPYSQALEMTRYLDNENSYIVWKVVDQKIYYIEEMLLNTEYHKYFKKYFCQKVKPVTMTIGWELSTNHMENLHRSLTLALAMSYGDEESLNRATMIFKEWINNKNYTMLAELRPLVYMFGVFQTGPEEWEMVLERYMTEEVETERYNLLRALAATKDVHLLNKYLENTKNSSIIKNQDFFIAIVYVSYSIVGSKMAWTWVCYNWNYMIERFGVDNRRLGQTVKYIATRFSTDVQLWEVETFFEKDTQGGVGEKMRKFILSQIKANIEWAKENKEMIGEWLLNNS